MNRHVQFAAALAALTLLVSAQDSFSADNDPAAIKAEVTKRHDEAVKRLRDWIKLPSIAAEDLNYPPPGRGIHGEAPQDAGFQQGRRIRAMQPAVEENYAFSDSLGAFASHRESRDR